MLFYSFRMRDLSAHEKHEIQKLQKDLEDKKTKTNELQKTVDKQQARINDLEKTVAELHEQVRLSGRSDTCELCKF